MDNLETINDLIQEAIEINSSLKEDMVYNRLDTKKSNELTDKWVVKCIHHLNNIFGENNKYSITFISFRSELIRLGGRERLLGLNILEDAKNEIMSAISTENINELGRIEDLIKLGRELVSSHNNNYPYDETNDEKLTEDINTWHSTCIHYLDLIFEKDNKYSKGFNKRWSEYRNLDGLDVIVCIEILKDAILEIQPETTIEEIGSEIEWLSETDPIEEMWLSATDPKTRFEPTVTINIPQLIELIKAMFDPDELEELRLNLKIEEEFLVKTKSTLVREIVTYMQRRKRINELIKEIFTDERNEKWIIDFIRDCIE